MNVYRSLLTENIYLPLGSHWRVSRCDMYYTLSKLTLVGLVRKGIRCSLKVCGLYCCDSLCLTWSLHSIGSLLGFVRDACVQAEVSSYLHSPRKCFLFGFPLTWLLPTPRNK